MRHFFNILISALLLSSCTQSTSNEKVEINQEANFSKTEISIFTISAIMHQSPSIISANQENGIYLVTYNRPSDGKTFAYKVKFDGVDKVIWATIDGRWRNSELDEEIKYSVEGDKLKITQKFSDGSKSEKEFLKNNIED
ncbi:MAG: hypothetical protein COW03_11135 [Cytophagales bacterium CG12_big_fil_rev_8_21_14_0_65_40_12]|nr:MAG: hypothetical protein COW03_11135 [Cytophagales bacterium CG12_big_fil_rev_8_21_14_0_65_40_12]PIW03503.1 MAG: hypothetical protein COW40_14350 [Cytophagales bacterium CG17_big_fil_post_rev_8_21_14_2_50_40_13]